MIVTIEDDLRRPLTFGAVPKRVVSLVPSDTYNVAALGCASALVGRTDYCELPEAILSLPSVGGTKNPKLDAIRALEPDLVIANKEENTKSDLEALAQEGWKIYVCFPRRAADGIAHLARLSKIFRVEKDARVRDLLKRGYEAIRAAEARKMPKVRTFCPIWMKPLMTINSDTFISDVLSLAGAENVFADRERRYPLAADHGKQEAVAAPGRDTRYPRVTMEEVLAKKPDLVLLPDEPHPFTDEDADTFRAAGLANVVKTSGKDLCWYGARTIEGLDRVHALIERAR